MEKLKLNTLNIFMIQIGYGLENIFPAFSGKPQDSVDNNFQIALSEFFDSLLKTGKSVASPNICGGFIMDSLQP